MGARQSEPGNGVVVPAINTASSAACLRSLGRHDVRTIAISEHESPPGFASKYCDEHVSVPDPTIDFEGYEAAIRSIAKRRDVRTILPLRESDVYVLARNKESLDAHVSTPWPSLDTLRAVQDRVRLFDAAENANVGTPATKTLDDWDDWDRDVIVKPRYTVHAAEYSERFAESHTQWSSTRYLSPDDEPDPDELIGSTGHVPLIQEYVPNSDEYGFFALYDDGEAVATFQHRQRRGWKYSGGPSAYRESVSIPELDAAGRRLLDELDWHGLAMVEFLRNPTTGEFELMEVNPRIWSSLPFTVQAGVDFPHLYWKQATGQPITPPEYDVGMAGHLLRGELLHLHSILFEDYPLVERPSFARSLFDVVFSLVRHPRFDYLDPDDPDPFVRDCLNALGGVAGTGRTNESAGRASGFRMAVRTLLTRR